MKKKSLLGLLYGITRSDYYKDADITYDLLKAELYPQLSECDFQSLYQKMRNMIRTIASSDMDFNQLDAFLTSQVRRKESGITDDQAQVITRFWKNHRTRIHESLIQQSNWNQSLKDISWRVDVKAGGMEPVDSTPVAIVQMLLEDTLEPHKLHDVVQFEMDEQQLSSVLQSMKNIDNKLSSLRK